MCWRRDRHVFTIWTAALLSERKAVTTRCTSEIEEDRIRVYESHRPFG